MSLLMVINTTALDHDDRLRKEVASLRALDIDVQILGLEYANRAGRSIVYDGVIATTLRLRSRGWFTRGHGVVLKTLEMYLRLVPAIVIMRPAMVWCHGLEMSGLVPVLAALRGCGWIQRVIWDQHELPGDALLRSRVYKPIYAWLINLCDRIVMASHERRALVIEWQPRRRVAIEVLENFADDRFATAPPGELPGPVAAWLQETPYVLAQGGANPDRHLTNLVGAVVQNRWFKLLVVGPYTPTQVEDLERAHGAALHRWVLFTGPLPQLDIPPFIDHTDASVVLYQMDSQNTRLCAPNRLYQSLARGIPVVVGANPPMARIVSSGHCGVVLRGDGEDQDDLREGLRVLAGTRPALQAQARLQRDFTWESQLPTISRIVRARTSGSVAAVCLLPIASDARIHRRLAILMRLGFKPTVMAFERPSYPGKPLACGYTSLGRIEHGRYTRRLSTLLSALPAIRAACAGADVVYAFGLDLLGLAWLATRWSRRKPRFVYEVADIHPTLVGDGVIALVMRAIERRLLRDTGLLVVTSEAFISGFYKEQQRLSGLTYQLVENKPDLGTLDSAVSSPESRHDGIAIGYFGMIRCERSWRLLKRLAVGGQGRVRVYVRGVPLNLRDFEADARDCPWLEYGGPYVAPEELPEMYGRVDLVWIAHRVDDKSSFRWNRLNRFYESCAFRTPMIAQSGTQDGNVVVAQNLGLAIDLMNPDEALERILQLTAGDLEQWRANISSLPPSVYREDGEHERLIASIRALAEAV